MKRPFPVDLYPELNRRKRKFPRLRYLLMPALVILVLFFMFPDSNGGKEISRKVAGDKGKAPAGAAVPAKNTVSPGAKAPAVRSVPFKSPLSPLTKKDLVRIDQDMIRNYNLTIDWSLQEYISEMAARYKLYYGSMVVIDARTGDILALYGQRPEGQDCSLALDTDLAASIFKLVTATAAMEKAGFTGRSMFSYTGNAHTLYKRQLTNKRDRWTVDISLEDAFARSNNIVFAKLGTIYLGESPIYMTARKMGFYKRPLRECESTPSTSYFPTDDYSLAELACGFNKQTRISPIHAAQMVTAVLNSGNMLTPRIKRTSRVEQVPVMKRETAQNLHDMMERTIKRGTVSKTFRNVSSDRVLKHISIGAKSGSLDGDEPKGRRNWFVGYAQDLNTGEGITIGCLLILKDHFWIEADMLSRLVIRHHFSRPVDVAQASSISSRL